MKQLKIKLVKSIIKCLPAHKACVKGLGLRRINNEVIRLATPENLGMIEKVKYLLKIEELKVEGN